MADAKNVKRNEVVQAFLELYEKPRYLEVGVSHGNTFLNVTAERKVAVDPRLMFDYKSAAKDQPGSEYHEVTSDDYFGSIRKNGDVFDVIYLDGLHTFEQILRDFVNAITASHEKSVIIIDDVRPSTYHSSLKTIALSRLVKNAQNLPDNSWMGDVYKIVQFIESYAQSYSYAVVGDNHGQLVAWRKSRPTVIDEGIDEIARAPYEAIFTNQAHQKRMPLSEIRQLVVRDLF